MPVFALVVAVLFNLLAMVGTVTAAEEGTWKTTFIKRGNVGLFEAAWAGGPGATQRMRTPLQFAGTQIRVHVRGDYTNEIELTRMALVKGADDHGRISGTPFPISFAGKDQLKLAKNAATAVSDAMHIPVTAGTWYIEDQYASPKFPYAYEVDLGFYAAGDAFAQESMDKTLTCRTGVLTQVDVFTTDPRASILCYGDSITHGFNSTPNTDQRYPAILGQLLKRPVLNLGQNSDLAIYGRNMASATHEVLGVDTVIFLMGINDLIGGKMSKETYADIIHTVIQGAKAQQRKIYIGTILPAGGYAAFDADPAKETLRTAINAWIRLGNGATGVIDFAAALADPAKPDHLRADCQSDWLHPNDLGYRRMAESAAAALGKP